MQKLKQTVVTFILVVASSFGVFTIYGTEVATGTTVSGHISIDTTWNLGGSPYIVINDVVVDPGVTLTIEPETQVRFESPGPPLSIFVEGNLVSMGEPNRTIEFTSNGPTPQVFDWESIRINSTGYVNMSFTEISYSTFGVEIHSSNNTVVNSFFTNDNVGVYLGPSSSANYVANNTADSVYDFVWLDSSSFNTVKNNTITNGDASITLYDSFHNLLEGNTITNHLRGIDLHWSSNNNTIRNNTILNGSEYGLYLFADGYDTVENNVISLDGGGIGIEVQLQPGTRILNNTVSNCDRGVYFGGLVNDHVFIGNNVSANNMGMYVGYTQRGLITRNDFTSNSVYGLSVRNASSILIYHNNFIYNGLQAEKIDFDDFWDNGYPSGGNYWSDYQGNDSFWGVNQNKPGSDGIGDLPYNITTNGTDRYPLTEPNPGNLPPRNLDAHLSGPNYENVTITWNVSWNDGQRANDVTGYEVYRSSNYDGERVGYILRATLPNRTEEFVDNLAGDGDPFNFFYYVCAVNGTGNSSCTQYQVGKFTRFLQKGWNLVSVPLRTTSIETDDVLKTLPFETVRYYDASDQFDHWKEFTRYKPYNDLLYITLTMGVWVETNTDGNLTVAGKVPEKTVVHLKQGWNLMCYPRLLATNISDIQTGAPIIAEAFSFSAIPYNLKTMSGGDQLLPGHAYWLNMAFDTSLEFTN